MAKQKWYVVWQGHEPGIYTTWAECQRQTKGVSGAKFKSFTTQAEAAAAYSSGVRSSSPGKPTAPAGAKRARSESAPKGGGLPPVTLEVYCDGACEPNPGPAGSGLAVYRHGKLDSLYYGLFTPRGTNNTAELHALHRALMLAQTAIEAGESVRIHADSKYALQCVSEWASGWKKRGWKRPNGDPVKNPDIIAPAHELYRQIADKVELAHVKAHAGVEGNELADRMAMMAALTQEEAFTVYPGALDVAEILAFKRG